MMNPVLGWFANPSRRKTRSTARSRRCIVGLEALEVRVVLSTYTVNSLLDVNPPAGVTTLRQAITAADSDNNTDPEHPDVINLAVDGTIALGSALPALTGSVAIAGPGAADLTIQGDGHGEAILDITGTGPAIVSGVTIDGDTNGNSGITVNPGASLAIDSDVVQNCYTSADGAGLLINGGSVSVLQSSFVDDVANVYGAGIANEGGSLSISQSTFNGNVAFADGAGVYDIADSAGNGGSLIVLASTFSNNLAFNYGGGIGLDLGADATVVDCTFTGNSSQLGGGAIDLHGRHLTGPQIDLRLSGSTVTNNSTLGPGYGSVGGGGIYVRPSSTAQPVLLNDTIVAANTENNGNSGYAPNDVTGAIDPTSSFNLIGDGSTMTGITIDVNGNMIGTDANPINPEVGPLQNNGGPTMTVSPLPGSPAIDRGGPDPVGDDYTSSDQRGDSRIISQKDSVLPVGGDGRDIGAFELALQTPTILIVNSTADANPPAGVLTLREALEAANGTLPFSSLPASQVQIGSSYTDEIDFSVTGTIALNSVLPTVSATTAVALEGPGASSLLIKGDGLQDEVLSVAPGASLTVAGLTLDGNLSAYGYGQNGGISVETNAILGVQNAVIQNALANVNGGGVFNQSGFVTLSLSTFSNNNAVEFGAGVSTLGGSFGVSECLFTDNTTEGDGGAIDVEGSLGYGRGTPGVLTIIDSTFAGNMAIGPNGGGALYFAQSTLTSITNSTFSGNSALGAGGAILVFESTLNLSESTLTGNSDENGAGGIFSDATAGTTLHNTIVAGNFLIGHPDSPSDVRGGIAPGSSYNLIGDGDLLTGIGNGVDGNLIGTGAAPINAELLPLANNGGPTETVALLPESPAIDAGDPDTTGLPEFDQRGTGFGRVVDGRVDIGAYEYEPSSIGLGVDTVVANPGGPYTINEGDTLNLNGAGSSDTAGFTLTYSWTINGVANAATGVAPSLSFAQLAALGIDNGPNSFVISVTVNDGNGQVATASTTLTVNDVPANVSAGNSTSLAQGGTLSRQGSFTDSAFDAPFTGTVNYGDGGGLQALTLSSGDTYDLSHAYDVAGTFTVTVAVTDKDGVSGQASFQVTVVAPPAVSSFQINDGNIQRSMVDSLTVTFTTAVTATAGAFEVAQQGGGDIAIVVTPSEDLKTYVITFTGAGIVGGSLPDGRYTLTVNDADIHETSSLDLAMTTSTTEQFFRLYGDANGDGQVNNLDLAYFRSTYMKTSGQAGYLGWLDYNQDGTVGASDYAQFLLRYGKHI